MISEQVKRPLRVVGLGVKTSTTKLPQPDQYDGDEDIEVFDTWVQSLLRWLKLSHYGGPDFERERIALAAVHLTGKASQWFNDNVEGVARRKRHWKFRHVITGLYDRFIHDASIQDATTKFYAAKFTASNGVSGYYHDLQRYASRMIHSPDSYTFKTQFLMGLPTNISDAVLDDGVSAETSSRKTILRTARSIEEGNHIKRRYQERKRAAASGNNQARIMTADRALATQRSKSRSRPTESRTASRQPYTQSTRKSVPPAGYRPAVKSFNTKPGVRPSSKPPQSKPPQRLTDRTATPNTTCFACNGKGHYATDPKCPKYGTRTRMAAIQEGEEDGNEPQQNESEDQDEPEGSYRLVIEDDDAEEETPLHGSQYTSEGEEYELDEYDGYTPDDDNEGAYMRAIREEPTGKPVTVTISSIDDGKKSLDYSSVKSAVRKSRTDKPRPAKDSAEIQPMVARIQINGLTAIAMMDSGSTADAISPEFARVSNAKVYALTEQIPIRLGCRGSKSRITYGTDCTVKYGTVDEKYYLDIVNIDRYDAIIGIGFMRRFGIKLDPASNQIWIRDKPFPALSEGEERTEIARRQSVRPGAARRSPHEAAEVSTE
jgi:hypothetical protein